MPLEILVNGIDYEVSKEFDLINKIDIPKKQVFESLKDMLGKIFRDIEVNFSNLNFKEPYDPKLVGE